MAAAFDVSGNPSSVHTEGRAAARLIEDARAAVAALSGAMSRNVVFTSGGTEANALALTPGLAAASGEPVQRLIVSAIEHPSVLAGGRFRRRRRSKSRRVTGDGRGRPRRSLRRCWQGGRRRWCRSCWRTTRPARSSRFPRLRRFVHEAGGILHVDAVQALAKMPLNIKRTRRRSSDGFCAQDRRPKRRRRADRGRRLVRACSAADPRRRSGAGPPGRNRECRRHCRLWRGRERPRSALAAESNARMNGLPTGWRQGSGPSLARCDLRRQVCRACRTPPCSQRPACGRKPP